MFVGVSCGKARKTYARKEAGVPKKTWRRFDVDHVGLETAKELARLYLKNPKVLGVFVFGSCGMWGDGHDIDLVLEVTTEKAIEFLRQVRSLFDRMAADPDVKEAVDWYGVLKSFRERVAHELIGYVIDRKYVRTLWHGMWREWDRQCKLAGPAFDISRLANGQPDEIAERRIPPRTGNPLKRAETIEMLFFRQPDIFLMPVGWRADPEVIPAVAEIMPEWGSDRPWAKEFTFYEIMRLQARKFNTKIVDFDPREPSNNPEIESRFQRAAYLARRRWERRKIRSLLDILGKGC